VTFAVRGVSSTLPAHLLSDADAAGIVERVTPTRTSSPSACPS
jgi:hypothetical protein